MSGGGGLVFGRRGGLDGGCHRLCGRRFGFGRRDGLPAVGLRDVGRRDGGRPGRRDRIRPGGRRRLVFGRRRSVDSRYRDVRGCRFGFDRGDSPPVVELRELDRRSGSRPRGQKSLRPGVRGLGSGRRYGLFGEYGLRPAAARHAQHRLDPVDWWGARLDAVAAHIGAGCRSRLGVILGRGRDRRRLRGHRGAPWAAHQTLRKFNTQSHDGIRRSTRTVHRATCWHDGLRELAPEGTWSWQAHCSRPSSTSPGRDVVWCRVRG